MTGAPSDYPLLIGQLLANLPQFAEQEIVSDGKRFTYAQFARRLRQLANVLTDLGVKPGMTVAVMDWDSHRYLEAYFAVPMIGAILQTVNVRLAPAQITFTLRQSCAQVLLYHPDFRELAQDFASSSATPPRLFAMADYEDHLAAAATDFDFPELDENTLATTFHTSGTSGDPKAVSFTHRQLVLHTLAMAGTLANQPDGEGFRRSDVYMPMTPMFHVHAWGMPYLATMLGAKQVYPGRYDPDELLRLQHEEGVTFSHCVPTILRMLLDCRTIDARPLRWTIIIGGSALSEALRIEAHRHGIVAIGGYGMSETGPVVALSRSVRSGSPALLGRAGFPVPLVWARCPRTGNDNQAGELQLRAPWLTAGYRDDSTASAALWADSWLHTQDLARIDADGAISIVDRIKDVIKTGGEWVSSLTLEDLCARHPDVVEVAVVGIPDDRWGERPVLFVVPVPERPPPTLASIHELLRPAISNGTISRYAIPDRIISRSELPRNSTGKLDKASLRTSVQ
ncbi:long-chain-fatty-acid--CoA ligase [Novosphingobium sp. 9]|uniref:long-chain-fatty-acid--CoA ligase n=1 Tax=Novosphingobium sp. 9 TaxID=2025349 RepID=UPI0021B53941|nr:long-chain-fatty-acid--CoA ligase [Novosphingobium sp. 9]